MNRRKKIVSKYIRLKISDTLMDVIKATGAKDLEETQVGDFVYKAMGKLRIGSKWYPVTVYVKDHPEGLQVTVSCPGVGLKVSTPLEAKKLREELKKAKERLLN